MKALTALTASLGIAAMGSLAATPALADQHKGDKEMKEAKKSSKTIVGVAGEKDDFSTLVKAVKTAELVETLEGDGPYTVFAPDNAAFENLPEGAVEQLLREENRPALRSVLTYHVVKGAIRASDLTSKIEENDGSYEVSTVEGEKLTAKLQNGNVVLMDKAGNTIRVTATDIDASNGVIHVIDTVALPVAG